MCGLGKGIRKYGMEKEAKVKIMSTEWVLRSSGMTVFLVLFLCLFVR